MTVYVTTDYDGCEYITPGKPYELRDRRYITDDEGDELYVKMSGCVRLDGANWRYTNEGMQIETGTLKELNVKPGDVVECVNNCDSSFVNGERYDCVKGADGFDRPAIGPLNPKGKCIPSPESDIVFRLISRASNDTPKTWGEMTDEERREVPSDVLNDPTNPLQIPWGEWSEVAKGLTLLAHHEGRAIAVWGLNEWLLVFGAQWIDDHAYRVRPEPKRKTVTIYGRHSVWEKAGKAAPQDTHRITFDTIDGKPDCNSIKMEEM